MTREVQVALGGGMQVQRGAGREVATALVPIVLFGIGVAAMQVIGRLLSPVGAGGSSLQVGDFYIGWTAGLALVLVWTVAGLGQRTGFLASTAVVAGLFYVVLTGGTYIASLTYSRSLATSRQTAGTDSGAWFVGAVLIGLIAAIVASLLGGLILWRLGRLRAAAIMPGMIVGGIGVVLGYMVFIDLYTSTI